MEATEFPNRRVLVVDDQAEIHNDFEEILVSGDTEPDTEAFGMDGDDGVVPAFELSHAMNGVEACDMVRAARDADRPFALAYMDIRMPPGIDGVEAIGQIRQYERDLEIVIMTAYTDKPLSEIVRDIALPHKLLYIRKPFAREEVEQITLSLVGKWNVEQALAQSRRQLEVSHQRLQAVLDATGDAIVMIDAGGRLQVANREYQKLLGASEADLKHMPPEELRARVRACLRPPLVPALGHRLFLDNVGQLEEEITATAPPRLFFRSQAPVRDDRHNLLGHVTVYRDVSRDVESEHMKAELLRLRSQLDTGRAAGGVVGQSSVMRGVRSDIQQAAESNITVLIQGESGTGKELVARMIHAGSARNDGPLVVVNCAAMPETLIESELFGHERGAFTGAARQRIGQFEHAQKGTILLDEIGDMPMLMQVKLLRVLEEREIQRVGGADTIAVDVRVIAATNRNLADAVAAGEFRSDLYYRLAVLSLSLPPLRDHCEDIPLLVAHFLQRHAENDGHSVHGISPPALRQLLVHDWPGNVRELRNVIDRAVLLEKTDRLQVGSLPPELLPSAASGRRAPAADLSLAQVERRAIRDAVEASNYNVDAAAQVLGINRATLYRKMKKHGLPTKP